LHSAKQVGLFLTSNTWAALKVTPPTLLHWHKKSEMVVGGLAVETEPSHQYSIACCCRVTDGSRGAVRQNGSDVGVEMKQRGMIEFLHVEHMAPTWALVERLWRPNSGCEHSGGGTFQ